MARLIVVCLRPVWRTDIALRLAPDGHAPRPDGAHPVADPAGLAALHVALGLRAAGAAERVEAWSAGGVEAQEVLREALAHGADAVQHWGGAAWPPGGAALGEGSAAATAGAVAVLSAPLRQRAPVLVLCGERSSDAGHEAFGALLAHALGSAFAHRATQVAAKDGGWQVTVKLERGYAQEMALPAPALVSVSPQAGQPGYPALPAWLAARQASIPTHPAAPPAEAAPGASTLRVPVPRVKAHPTLPPALDAEARIRAMVTVETGSGGDLLGANVGPERQAEAAVALLRERGYLPSEG